MDRNSIYIEYTSRLSTRDSLGSIEKETSELEESEIVKRYLRLVHYLKSNEYLKDKNDKEVLDDLLDSVKQDEEESYFCFGKDFVGHIRKIGGYYIDYNPSSIRLNPGIRVAKYKSLVSNEEVIIPIDETVEFEKNSTIYFPHMNDKEEEYKALRRTLFLNKVKGDKVKKLDKRG